MQNGVKLKSKKETENFLKNHLFKNQKKRENYVLNLVLSVYFFMVASRASRLSWETASEVVRGISRCCGDFQFYDIG